MTFWQLSLPKRGQQDAKKQKRKKRTRRKKTVRDQTLSYFRGELFGAFRLFRCRAENERAKIQTQFKMLGLHHNTFA